MAGTGVHSDSSVYFLQTGSRPAGAASLTLQARRAAMLRLVITDIDGTPITPSDFTTIVVSFRLRPFDSTSIFQRTQALSGSLPYIDFGIPRTAWAAVPWQVGQRFQILWFDITITTPAIANPPTPAMVRMVLVDSGNASLPLKLWSSIRGLP